MQLQLPSGLVIPDAEQRLDGYMREWWPIYEGVPVAEDDSLGPNEIAASTMLNSRLSGNTGKEIWKRRSDINRCLSAIPQVDLLDIPSGASIPAADAIETMLSYMCQIAWVNLAVATKTLHRKRPALLPILDSHVHDHYSDVFRSANPRVRIPSRGCFAVHLIGLIHADMVCVEQELRQLVSRSQANGTPMTACRILNFLTWTATN